MKVKKYDNIFIIKNYKYHGNVHVDRRIFQRLGYVLPDFSGGVIDIFHITDE